MLREPTPVPYPTIPKQPPTHHPPTTPPHQTTPHFASHYTYPHPLTLLCLHEPFLVGGADEIERVDKQQLKDTSIFVLCTSKKKENRMSCELSVKDVAKLTYGQRINVQMKNTPCIYVHEKNLRGVLFVNNELRLEIQWQVNLGQNTDPIFWNAAASCDDPQAGEWDVHRLCCDMQVGYFGCGAFLLHEEKKIEK